MYVSVIILRVKFETEIVFKKNVIQKLFLIYFISEERNKRRVLLFFMSILDTISIL